MSVTITASFEASNITELQELLTMIGDNEPIDVQMGGCFHFGYSDAGQHLVDEDQTPPHGTERPNVMLCNDSLCDVEGPHSHSVVDEADNDQVIEWPGDPAVRKAQYQVAAQRARDAEWSALTSDAYEAMKLFAEFLGSDQRAQFIAICGELARDAWGSSLSVQR